MTKLSQARRKANISLIEQFQNTCETSSVGTEWTLHQISPYIGKIKSTIANFLIKNFTTAGDLVYDPFCGAGTIPLEAVALSRNIIANDLNEYAYVLTMGKLFPPNSIEDVCNSIENYSLLVETKVQKVDLRKVPEWVRAFFHKQTLREIIGWVAILRENEEWFLLSCLLGILHHQRPGFLSYPSSHTVPYLREKKFPREKYIEMYEYRDVKSRLTKKVKRAFRRIPIHNDVLQKDCHKQDASKLKLQSSSLDVIITSPPYMRQLDYARDNRLRLWFLGIKEYQNLDALISPKESDFVKIITACLKSWKNYLKANGKCILFLGDNYSKKYKLSLPEIIEKIATDDIGGYKLLFKHVSLIPNKRRVRRNYSGNKSETILVLVKTK